MAQLLPVEKVLQAIKQGLILGRWQPGDRLPLQALAKELDVSYAPVRDAVNELVLHGVLERRAGIGTSVAEQTHEDIANLWDIRAALEALGGRWLAERASDVALAALTAEAKALDEFLISAYEEISRLRTGPEFDSLRFTVSEAEGQFHGHFMDSAGGPSLLSVWKPCHFLLVTAIVSPYLAEWQPAVENLHRHGHVMEAVCSREPDLAEKTARDHVLSVREILLGQLGAESDQALRSEVQWAGVAEGR